MQNILRGSSGDEALQILDRLEIWGKAQRESDRRLKSDWGENSRGG